MRIRRSFHQKAPPRPAAPRRPAALRRPAAARTAARVSGRRGQRAKGEQFAFHRSSRAVEVSIESYEMARTLDSNHMQYL